MVSEFCFFACVCVCVRSLSSTCISSDHVISTLSEKKKEKKFIKQESGPSRVARKAKIRGGRIGFPSRKMTTTTDDVGELHPIVCVLLLLLLLLLRVRAKNKNTRGTSPPSTPFCLSYASRGPTTYPIRPVLAFLTTPTTTDG